MSLHQPALLIFSFPPLLRHKSKSGQVSQAREIQEERLGYKMCLRHVALHCNVVGSACSLLLLLDCYFLQSSAGELGEKDLSCSDSKYVLHYSYHYLRNFICLKINKMIFHHDFYRVLLFLYYFHKAARPR